jgi:hypothetical protein
MLWHRKDWAYDESSAFLQNKENSLMENSLTAWAQERAAIAERRTRAQDKRQNTSHFSQIQAETVWVNGMAQVVRILTKLGEALQHTHRFPDLRVLSYAQSPQGTTTDMRGGTLLSVRGVQAESASIEFEIDTTPPFRADLLAPTARVWTAPHPHHSARPRRAHWSIGVSVHGEIVWQRLNPELAGIAEDDNSGDILKNFLAFSLLPA